MMKTLALLFLLGDLYSKIGVYSFAGPPPLRGKGIKHDTTTQSSNCLVSSSFSLFSSQDSLLPGHIDRDSTLQIRHSARDWVYNIRSLPNSSVLKEIQNPVYTVALWGSLVSVLQKLGSTSSNSVLRNMASEMCIGATAHSFLVSSLGLLLVFRTNSAYQRFYEGRKIWEHIQSISRNLSRVVSLYEGEIGIERKNRVLHLIASFPYLLRNHIRPGQLCSDRVLQDPAYALLLQEPSHGVAATTRFEGDAGAPKHIRKRRHCWVDRRELPWSLLSNDSLSKLATTRNRPLWVCDRIGREFMNVAYSANYSSRERLLLLTQVEKLTNTIGQCERIHQTAVPLNYARHSLRAMTLWLLTLPFALTRELGFLTGPFVGFIAWLLFGVYQIGCNVEDPFQGSLRLSVLCDAIRQDVLERSSSSSTRETVIQPPQQVFEIPAPVMRVLPRLEEPNSTLAVMY